MEGVVVGGGGGGAPIVIAGAGGVYERACQYKAAISEPVKTSLSNYFSRTEVFRAGLGWAGLGWCLAINIL